MEIEKKWLVKLTPDLKEESSAEIRQGYLKTPDDTTELRVRQRGDHYYLTGKSSGGLCREETETDITEVQFELLWPLTEGRHIAKKRYVIPYQGHKIELDVYSGRHEGLLVAEVEFETEESAHSFVPPAWFGLEVTNDVKYKNKSLAKM